MRSLVWKLVLAALTLALVATPVLRTSVAWAAAPALEEAQKLYDGAQFNEAIAKIRDALSTGQVTGNDAIAARGLMARCLVKAGNRLEAKEAFKFVLRRQPGWKLDATTAGPDEQEVFQLAQNELTSEQIEAGKRIPASLSFNMGTGSGDNEDIAEIAVAQGGDKKFDLKPQIGGSVRFPVTQRLSLDLEMQRFRATNQDTIAAPGTSHYEVTAYPISLSLYYMAFSTRQLRLNVFAGGGLVTAISKIDLLWTFFVPNPVPLAISGQKSAPYFHGGLEAEYLAHPRIALTGRVMGRVVSVDDVMEGSDFTYYGQSLKDRKVDFSGFAATLGLRAYIGY